jgi:N-acetylmuramoyl-L-alanine amidase
MRFICALFLLGTFFTCAEVRAEVELGRRGQPPHIIEEVYNIDDSAYLALDDVLPAIGISGYWHSTQHRYFINLPEGQATLYPGGPYLKYGQRYIMLDQPARFIDGRLRISEQVILNQIAAQLPYDIYYRNLTGKNQDSSAPPTEQEQFFTFLLQKQFSHERQSMRGIALDPAHGGADVGVMGLQGIKEKDVVLDLARELKRRIKMQLGIPVYLTRNEDYTLNNSERLEVARENPVDMLLLLHAQAALTPDQQGIHLYVRSDPASDSLSTFSSDSSLALALRLSSALREAGFKVREVSSTPLLPLPRGNMPTVLIETGYLSNVEDVRILTQETRDLAAALLKGMEDFNAYIQ